MGSYLEAAKVVRAAMDAAAAALTDEQALKAAAIYPAWSAEDTYDAGSAGGGRRLGTVNTGGGGGRRVCHPQRIRRRQRHRHPAEHQIRRNCVKISSTTSAAYTARGEELLFKVRDGLYIPYVSGGMSLDGMDCQGLCEYLLVECGVPKSECNLGGSNSHWRNCVWRGTPEECAGKFGGVPLGAWVFIVEQDDSGAPAKFRGDGYGNASHMGVVLNGCALHASASRGCVAESRFAGETIPNGGWNAIGLPPWIDYGLDMASGDSGEDADEGLAGGDIQGETAPPTDEDAGLTIGDVTAAPREYYAIVESPNGYPVKLRKSASQKESVYWLVNPGARVRVEKEKGDWSLIDALCSDGYIRRAYMMSAFLRKEG